MRRRSFSPSLTSCCGPLRETHRMASQLTFRFYSVSPLATSFFSRYFVLGFGRLIIAISHLLSLHCDLPPCMDLAVFVPFAPNSIPFGTVLTGSFSRERRRFLPSGMTLVTSFPGQFLVLVQLSPKTSRSDEFAGRKRSLSLITWRARSCVMYGCFEGTHTPHLLRCLRRIPF